MNVIGGAVVGIARWEGGEVGGANAVLEFGVAADGLEFRGCVGGKVDLVVEEVLVGVFISEAEVSRVGAGAEGYDLFGGRGGGGEEAVDELVDCGGPHVGPWKLVE